MKKLLCLSLALILIVSLCACTAGEREPSRSETAPAQTAEAPDAAAVPSSGALSERCLLAHEYLDRSAEDLLAAIGEPLSADYAHSCDGDGEDGILEYGDFTVYTYRENGLETVVDVWP